MFQRCIIYFLVDPRAKIQGAATERFANSRTAIQGTTAKRAGDERKDAQGSTTTGARLERTTIRGTTISEASYCRTPECRTEKIERQTTTGTTRVPRESTTPASSAQDARGYIEETTRRRDQTKTSVFGD